MLHLKRHSFSRSYGVNMPSSLTIVLPIALVCSTCLPVSVLVRAPVHLPRGFSWKYGIDDFTQLLRLTSRAYAMRIFLHRTLHAFTGTSRTPIIYPSPSPHRYNGNWWYRNINLLCIGYALRPRLSSRLTLGGLALPRNP